MVEAARDGNGVMEAGNDDERADGVTEIMREGGNARVRISSAEQGEEDQGDFEKRGGLAEQARRKWPVALDDENNRGDDEQENVAADDQNREPPSDLFFHGQNDKRGAEKELVGDGVKIGAEGGFLVKTAGEKPIESVGGGADTEHEQCPCVFF